jgi:hypothetical protein
MDGIKSEIIIFLNEEIETATTVINRSSYELEQHRKCLFEVMCVAVFKSVALAKLWQ